LKFHNWDYLNRNLTNCGYCVKLWGITYMENRAIIPQEEIVAAANRIAICLSGSGQFDQDRQAPEVLDFARYALALRAGSIIPIESISLLSFPEPRKPEIAGQIVRQLLAPLALESHPRGYVRFFSGGMQEVRDFLGAGSRTKLVMAVNGLSDAEQQLFFFVAPVSLLQDLGFLDLDSCNPLRMAQYIRNASLGRNIAERDETLEMLLTSAVERADQQTIDLAGVVGILCQTEERDLIFERLIESAQWGEFRDQLIQLFGSYHQTAGLVDLVRRQMDREDVDIDNPPKYRVSADR